MAIIQISKIQQRSGNLVDLPQLDEAQFGWASDAKRLFIGKTSPNENVEVLTAYSNISFSQVEGAGSSNVNIDANSLQNGQLLTYVETTNTWENYTGNSSQIGNSKIQLGNVANISMTGGATGFVLQTDGLGNLSWTPKTTIVANIVALSNATPIVMTVDANIPYTNGTQVTISGVNGVANGNVNSTIFYVKLANDFPTTGNVKLYLDSGLTSNSNGTSLTYTNSPNALSIATVGGTSTLLAAGTNTSIQFNNGGTLQGSPYLNILNGNGLLTHTGPYFSVGNVYANSGAVVASQLTGSLMTNAQPNITSVGTLTSLSVSGNATVGNLVGPLASGNSNISITSNANITMYVAGNTTARFTATSTGVVANGTLSASGNSNVGNLGTAQVLATANITAPQLISNVATGTAPFVVTSTTQVANLSVATAGSATTAGTVTTAAQGNITSVGTLTSLSVSGNANVGNLGSSSNTGTALNIVGATQTTTNTSGGNINITAGAGNGTGAGGGLYAYAGNAQTTGNSAGGEAQLVAGTGYGQGQGGQVGIYAGASGNANGAFGGNIILSGGTYTGLGGNLVASAGTSYGTDKAGGITLISGGKGTGAGAPGNVAIQVSTALASGTTTQTLANVIVITATGANVSGTLSASGNLNAGNIITGGIMSSTGNATHGNIITGGIMSSTGNATHGNIITGGIVSATGNLQGGNLVLANAAIITVGANTNVGTITGNWSLSTGSRLNATYADLAEYYEADSEYEPGTVLEFGGDKEVTIAQDGTTRVAGVVSTNPAYAMNANCQGIAVAIALQGRVPTKVRGLVRKGDMMVSAGNGYARPWNNPQMGTVIGKALENFEGIEGVIEVAVGRL